MDNNSTENDERAVPPASGRWKRPAYVVVVLAAMIMVMVVWFRIPEVQVESLSAEGEFHSFACANGGSFRWDPPKVVRGQEVNTDPNPLLLPYNQQILGLNIDSLRTEVVCGKARDAHTNTLIVTTFAAGVILFFGYHGLWTRRADEESSRIRAQRA